MKKYIEIIVLGVVCLGLIGLGVVCLFTGNREQLPLLVNAVLALLGYAGGVARARAGAPGGGGSAGTMGTGAAIVLAALAASYGVQLLG